ncbi:MAG: helix-turn-helix domain-containing protein [Phycisphaerales bacterium JB043]
MDKSIYSQRQEILQRLLRDIRGEAGLRQVDLAKKLGQPQSFVSKYESGERRLDILELIHVCECCDISIDDFVNRFLEGDCR